MGSGSPPPPRQAQAVRGTLSARGTIWLADVGEKLVSPLPG